MDTSTELTDTPSPKRTDHAALSRNLLTTRKPTDRTLPPGVHLAALNHIDLHRPHPTKPPIASPCEHKSTAKRTLDAITPDAFDPFDPLC